MNSNHDDARSEVIHADLSYSIVGAFYEVHNELGYGFNESIYARALEIVLRARGMSSIESIR